MLVTPSYDESISKKRDVAFAGRIKRARPVHRCQKEARADLCGTHTSWNTAQHKQTYTSNKTVID
jgi:hypothetical protein